MTAPSAALRHIRRSPDPTRPEPAAPAAADLAGRRILVIMPSVPVEGMERTNLQIMRMLKERGADILCVTERDYGESVVRELEHIGCRWTPISCATNLRLPRSARELWRMLRYWQRTASAIRRIIADYEPTHIHVTNLTFFLLAWPALRRRTQPVVFRVPDPPDTDLPWFKQRLSNAIWKRLVVPRADVLVCNSRYTLSVLQQVVSTDKAVVINNCLPERSASAPSDAPVTDRTRFNVAFVGRIRPAKGADHLIDAAVRMLRDGIAADFYLAGEYQWKNPFADSLVRRVEREGMSSHIRFLGHINDVFGLLHQCDLHAHPAMAEPFGNAILEAKHCSLPSVVFPYGEPPNIVAHGVDGYVCQERSARALYSGIRYFYDNPAALLAARTAARRSLDRFSLARAATLWTDLYGHT